MHNGHPAAEAAEHLAKLKADVASAQDNQTIRDLLHVYQRFIREIADGFETGQAGRIRPGTCVDENAPALQNFVGDLELAGRKETRVAAIETEVWPSVHRALLARAEALHHSILASDDRG